MKKCKEFLDDPPYTSLHIFPSGIHGEPSGVCEKCGISWHEWDRTVFDTYMKYQKSLKDKVVEI